MADPAVHITVLGSGTSAGVPTVGCCCEVCRSTDPRDNRLRPSILIRYDGRVVLIDTTPDFRTQALRARIERIDAILLTHSHADHILGLDDVRPYNYRQRQAIPLYAMDDTLRAIQRVFPYAFDPLTESAVPKLNLHTLNGSSFDLFGLEFTPIPLVHGKATILGFRFGAAAYLTDHNDIPEASKETSARAGCLVPGCRCAAPPSPNALHRGTEPQMGRRTQAAARLLYAHLPRHRTRADRGNAAAQCASGLRRPRN